MEEVVKKSGRTILFVSHNLEAVRRLCTKCVLLEKGEVKSIGATATITNEYANREANYTFNEETDNEIAITNIAIRNEHKQIQSQIPIDKPFYIEVDYTVKKPVLQALFCVHFFTSNNNLIVLSSETDKNPSLRDFHIGKYKTVLKIPAHLFNVGNYYFEASVQIPFIKYLELKRNIPFEILDIPNSRVKIFDNSILGAFAPIFEYDTKKIIDA